MFTPDLNITNSIPFMNTSIDLLGNILNGNPTILPVPQDAPAYMPRFQISSSDGKWALSISLIRTDLFYLNMDLADTTKPSAEDFSRICSNFLSNFKSRLNFRVQRLAFITERILQHENPSSYIIDRFCLPTHKNKGKAFSNPKHFEIHSHKQYDWNEFHLNSWVRIKSIDFKTTETIPVILLENDLNTFDQTLDPDISFSFDDINRFFTNGPEHLDGILEKYFS